ncbi:MAG TPA: hypothetical protein VFE36_10485 [Candidatus Baltobacteraceae bacterium]|nr:hypothetical protein [Candidatus Baltobacteraceae bacterium]
MSLARKQFVAVASLVASAGAVGAQPAVAASPIHFHSSVRTSSIANA